ncbi:MAG: hypothetical protein QXG91_00130 [Candidatus Aenigmatarchaeota archaeon]
MEDKDPIEISKNIDELWKITEPIYKEMPHEYKEGFNEFLSSLYSDVANFYQTTITLEHEENLDDIIETHFHTYLNELDLVGRIKKRKEMRKVILLTYNLMDKLKEVIKSKILDIYEEMMGIKVRKSLDEIIDNSKIKNILEKYGIERNDAFYTMLYSTFIGLFNTLLYSIETESGPEENIIQLALESTKTLYHLKKEEEEKLKKLYNNKEFLSQVKKELKNVTEKLLSKFYTLDENSKEIISKILEVDEQKPIYIT